jgi:hypothetical protein
LCSLEALSEVRDFHDDHRPEHFEHFRAMKRTQPAVVPDGWELVSTLGEPGKEGQAFVLRRTFPWADGESEAGSSYVGGVGTLAAMKQFKPGKSASTFDREVKMQRLAASVGAAPRVLQVPPKAKAPLRFIMEMCDPDGCILDVCNRQGGRLSEDQQWEIVALCDALDVAGVVHNDANPLNLMMMPASLNQQDQLQPCDITGGGDCGSGGGGGGGRGGSLILGINSERHGRWRFIDYGMAKACKPPCGHANRRFLRLLVDGGMMGLRKRGALLPQGQGAPACDVLDEAMLSTPDTMPVPDRALLADDNSDMMSEGDEGGGGGGGDLGGGAQSRRRSSLRRSTPTARHGSPIHANAADDDTDAAMQKQKRQQGKQGKVTSSSSFLPRLFVWLMAIATLFVAFSMVSEQRPLSKK